jgi:hypothetical protein
MLVEKGILAEELLACLRPVLEEIERDGVVYFVVSYDAESGGASTFVLGPERICGHVLGLVDPEYGWPVYIQIEEIHTVSTLARGPRRHPFICDGNRCLAVGVSVDEYAAIKKKQAESISAIDSRTAYVPTLIQRLCGRCGDYFAPVDFVAELCPECRASAAIATGWSGSDFSSCSLETGTIAATPARCECCSKDVSACANSDGRMMELLDVVAYRCPECVGRLPSLGKRSDYQLLERLSTNGTASVFRAWHKPTGRVLVIETLNSTANAADYRRLHHSLLLIDLVHPNLARVIGSGYDMCMEDFTGESLESCFERNGPMTPQEATGKMLPVLDALSYLHAKSFVHLDVKPMNIMLKRIGTSMIPKLAGFQFVRPFGKDSDFDIDAPSVTGGTLPFMPLEQMIAFDSCGPSADIYAAGVSIYYLLTGCYPSGFPTPLESKRGIRPLRNPLRMIMEDEPIPIEERTSLIPTPLAGVVNRAVRKNAADRYQTAMELRAAIDDAIHQI